MKKFTYTHILTGIGAFAIGGVMMATLGAQAFMPNSDVKTAIQKGDYSAFQSAVNKIANQDTHMMKGGKSLTDISQEEFNKMHDTSVARQEVEKALISDDYQAFSEHADERITQIIPDEETFHKAHEYAVRAQEINTKLTVSIQNESFDDFKAAAEMQHQLRDEVKTELFKKSETEDRVETDDMLQNRYNKFVEMYKQTGTTPFDSILQSLLPRGGHHKGGMMHKGMRGGMNSW